MQFGASERIKTVRAWVTSTRRPVHLAESETFSKNLFPENLSLVGTVTITV